MSKTFSFLRMLLLCVVTSGAAAGQQATPQQQAPLTSNEFLSLVRQLPKQPGAKAQIVEELRRRGIGFELTPGLRSFVATKSGNDPDLRRALEEAERRHLNPKEAEPPSLPAAEELLKKTREATADAVASMPDFVVKQLITRAYAQGTTRNWVTSDRLTVGVSYREQEGEKYRLLAVNGIASPPGQAEERGNYSSAGGTNSTGEFVSVLRLLFAPESKTDFKVVDAETLRGRRTYVYEFEVKRANSQHVLTFNNTRSVLVGYRGRFWVDRELGRILRVESEATEIPEDFPITASSNAIDYEWVTIPSKGEYLLPSRSVLVMTVAAAGRVQQSRNDIRFRNYQKYGSELKILDDDEFVEEETPEPPKKP
ncbi:MAG TPA: hypothetical protein VGX48_16885 [Pyrinomonadaceae bacterium]|nr:hypothetical protein [Pyrinomonadaceae bacterium]